MGRKKEYLFDIVPRWIRYSGLPRSLNREYGDQAWNIFSCLISLDCRFNPDSPDWFAQSYKEIADLTGLSTRTVSRYIRKFEEAGLISLIKGEFKGLKSKFKITDPLLTPKDPNSIRAVEGGFFARTGKPPDLRYYQMMIDRHRFAGDKKGADQATKGCQRGHQRVSTVPHYKNDYKIEKEDVGTPKFINNSNGSKPVTWEEGIARIRQIKRVLTEKTGV